jgi:hypothetical protein
MTGAKIVDPVIVLERPTVEVYRSIEDAIGEMEPVDVSNAAFEVFDSTGRKIRLGAPSEDGPIIILGLDDGPPDPAGVRAALLAYLDALGGKDPLAADAVLRQQALPELAWTLLTRQEQIRRGGWFARLRRLWTRAH